MFRAVARSLIQTAVVRGNGTVRIGPLTWESWCCRQAGRQLGYHDRRGRCPDRGTSPRTCRQVTARAEATVRPLRGEPKAVVRFLGAKK